MADLTAEWPITSHLFQQALDSIILPRLNISLKKPLCKRTACRWLVKLVWRLTVLWKGIYMDGHEREDVKKYHQEVFIRKPEQNFFELVQAKNSKKKKKKKIKKKKKNIKKKNKKKKKKIKKK